ncbi:MAG TPA: PAS domain S-box protein [Actinobacteria bacterium]|nr:PAS domain S-box protein [Actinomycetota bacterium]
MNKKKSNKQPADSAQTTVHASASALDETLSNSPIAPQQSETSEQTWFREKLTFIAQTFESAPEGIQITNLSGHILYANKAIEKIYGFSPEEQIGKHVGEMNEEPGFAEKNIIPSIRETGHWEGEVSVKHKDGRIFPIWLTTSVVKDDEGEPLAMTGISRDISEKKQAEAALLESEEKYRMLMDLANDAIFVADAETGLLVETNQKGSELIGRPISEIIGMHQSELHPPDKAEEYRKIFMEYVGKGQGVTLELFVRHSSGRDIPVEISASVFKLREKVLIKGIFRDLTTRKRARKLSDNLNEINSIINSTLKIGEIVSATVSTSATAIGADSAAFFLLDGDHWVLEQVHGPSPHSLGTRIPYEILNPPARMADNPEPVGISDALHDDRVNEELAKKIGLKSLLLIPLVSNKRILGLLAFRYFANQVEFSPEEMDFATKLGSAITMALNNARLFSEQQEIARVLQESLLVIPEKLPLVDFGHIYRSAAKAALVGGDFYDLFDLQGGRLGVVIGDVSGKGLGAAALTSILKHTIRSYAYEGHGPASIISKTNIVTLKETDSSAFVTVFVGILDTRSGVLTYCCAGHPLPIIKKKNGDIDILDTSCTALGVLEFLDPLDNQKRLAIGDILTLYTDGVIEARCEGGMFGEDHLIDFIRSVTLTSSSVVPQTIMDELNRRCGCEFSDDMAILSLSLQDDS